MEAHDLFSLMEEQMPSMLTKLEKERSERIKAISTKNE
jgi:hypothetical protein